MLNYIYLFVVVLLFVYFFVKLFGKPINIGSISGSNSLSSKEDKITKSDMLGMFLSVFFIFFSLIVLFWGTGS